jgi:type VI secretion system secreted protein VgrG
MASSYTQENRLLKLTASAGGNALLVQSFTVSERVSDIYEIDIEALTEAEAPVLKPAEVLGQPMTVRVSLDSDTNDARYFNGIVREYRVDGETERFRGYRFSVVPNLWLSTLSQNFRVFEKKTVPDILKEVLKSYGINPTDRLNRTYSPWDICTQYRETDFHFLSRVMEHEGIFYFFEHADGKNTMVLGDHPQAFLVCPQQAAYNFAPEIGPGDGDWLADWDSAQQLRTGSYRLWDWHMENATRFEADHQTAEAVAGNTKYKFSDFAGQFTQQFNAISSVSKAPAEAKVLTKLRQEQVETENPIYTAAGSLRALSAGQRFTVNGESVKGEYVVTTIQHSAIQFPPYIYGEFETPMNYAANLTCIKAGAIYRPAPRHKKPVVQGPQTAIVTERPDKYGRVRVKYHWGSPQPQSAWVRVAQKWAGPQYGAVFIPRPDHEVILEFLDGDPDQPIIVGCVYSATNMPPYTLPDNFTQSGIKTRSLTSGGDGGGEEFNELRFEDKKGSEDIYFHAQKDFHRVVENDDDLKVGHDQTIEIKNHRTEVVKDGNEKVTIETGKREIFVNKGNDLHQVKMGNREAIIDMGNDSLTVKMGNHIRKINLGKSETEAMQSIELKVGNSSIKVDQMGITMKGMMIKIEADVMLEQKSLMTKSEATAMMVIKGGITMIN